MKHTVTKYQVIGVVGRELKSNLWFNTLEEAIDTANLAIFYVGTPYFDEEFEDVNDLIANGDKLDDSNVEYMLADEDYLTPWLTVTNKETGRYTSMDLFIVRQDLEITLSWFSLKKRWWILNSRERRYYEAALPLLDEAWKEIKDILEKTYRHVDLDISAKGIKAANTMEKAISAIYKIADKPAPKLYTIEFYEEDLEDENEH